MFAAAVLFVIPFINRSPENNPRRNQLFTVFGIIAVLYIVVMTVVGYLA